MNIQVIKRDGKKEPLDLNKFHKVCYWACEDITGVSPSEIEIKSHISFYDGITTREIQETLIKAAADLISEETPNYQFVAGRLINYNLRKEVFRDFTPDHLYNHVKRIVKTGFYTKELLEWYSEDDWNYLNNKIDHTRDEDLTYAAMEQFRGKYLVKNRSYNEFYETPQIAYMLIAATLFHDESLHTVVEFYNEISKHNISLPTPVMAGVRTPQKQFSSCVLIESADDLDSIFTTAHAIGLYVAQRAGIGIGAGALRGIGSAIRGGQATHTGNIPFYRLFQSAVKSCSQGSIRGGSATLHYPIWHIEVEDLLVLKNNKGVDSNRLRQLDYSVQCNRLMYERLINGEQITLFSPNDVPGLYDAFFNDQDKFKELYEKAERNKNIPKKRVDAIELFSSFMEERKGTGRKYQMNVDHCNDHSSFDLPIKMSNLCQEITLPTKPLYNIKDDEGEIALCTLAAINMGNIKSLEDLEKPCYYSVMALNKLLDYQNYPIIAAELSTMKRRPLGIGLINLAYWMAKNDMTYEEPNLEMIDEFAEAWSYYLIKASADLAKKHGKSVSDTKYGRGVLPIDTYNKNVNELIKHKERMPWKELRQQLSETGIYNSTLMACMPAETSAQISNATNGVEPPRAFISVKQSKDGVLKQVVPEFRRLKNKYNLLWDQKSPVGYLNIMAVLQKYIDQSISVNTSYNPCHYKDEKIPMSLLLEHMLHAYKYGLKTLYYFNTYDGASDDTAKSLTKTDWDREKEQLVQYEIDDGECDSCTI